MMLLIKIGSFCLLFFWAIYGYGQVFSDTDTIISQKVYLLSEFGLGIGIADELETDISMTNPSSPSRRNQQFNIFSNSGIMFQLSNNWSTGLVGNININNVDIKTAPLWGLRTRVNYFNNKKLELNISPGIRTSNFKMIDGFDLEATISSPNNFGIFTRYERHKETKTTKVISKNLYTACIFVKGKKSIISTLGITLSVLGIKGIIEPFLFNK